MAAEIELKLALPLALEDALTTHPLIHQYQRRAPVQQALYNRYFDTPEQHLNTHAVALRIRRQGQNYIQTLKTRGVSQGGLHQRQEWEWSLPGDQLDTSRLPVDALPAEVDHHRLEPLFTTDFQRTTWILDYSNGSHGAEIELVFDQGWVSNGQQRDPIHEVELELKQGDAEALIAFASQLATSLPLRICRISKAERGYRLADPERARRLPQRTSPPTDCDTASAFYHLLEALLERVQSAIEGYEYLSDSQLLDPLDADLTRLQNLLDCYASALPSSELPSQLADLNRRLQQILAPLKLTYWCPGTGLDNQRRAHLEASLEEWINSLQLGQVLLALSSLLHGRPWHGPNPVFFDPGP